LMEHVPRVEAEAGQHQHPRGSSVHGDADDQLHPPPHDTVARNRFEQTIHPVHLGIAANEQNVPMTPDGRFAPAPTGPLHMGSLRTALVAWLFARSQAARFVLRIDDLDPQRSRRAFEEGQIAGLRALGLDWDGPAVRQSERLARYEAA